jgi:ABC-type molybdate transport system substrate-binding protein
MKIHLLIAAAIAFTVPNVTSMQAKSAEVKLVRAVGVRQIMLELGPRFERSTGHKLVI